VSEAFFPLLGPLLVFAFVLPLSALIAKLLLGLLDRVGGARGSSFAGVRYALIVASSALPLAWFVSASLHQTETGRSAEVCAAVHAPEAFCAEAAYFSLALCALGLAFALPRLIREQFMLAASSSAAARRVQARVERLVSGDGALAALRRRVVASDTLWAPLATVGIVSPRVVVRTSFADALDDEALVGALHHELEHVVERDPLRYFIAWWALAMNPFGRFQLQKEHARWQFAREAACDRHAVASGASAPALAQALLVAARQSRVTSPPFQAALGSPQLEVVKLRLGLLLAHADRAPQRCRHDPAFRWLLSALALAVALPHGGGTDLLDAVHVASELAASFVIGG
jgi:beta-lactamase regulating signal transducer with metallopeptidase domain